MERTKSKSIEAIAVTAVVIICMGLIVIELLSNTMAFMSLILK